ncbi:MAG: glycosyltransferase [Phycisphaerae bacterium]|nr:glycosyltransferase [Phycisphaerae bacterium]
MNRPPSPVAFDCSLIIPTRNRREVLRHTLEKLHALPDSRRFEMIVVDNGSTDGSESLRWQFPRVRWISLEENMSAAARNVGARAARGRILFMLDDDSWPEPGVLDRVVSRMDERRELGAVACRVLLADSPQRHDAGGVPGVIFNCGGAVRRDSFLDTGGYPPEFGYYVEEYALCCRLWQRGLRIEPHGELVVRHRRTAENRDHNRMVRYLIRNNVALWRRFAPDSLREDLIASTLERYRRVAVKEGALIGYEAAIRGLEGTDAAQDDSREFAIGLGECARSEARPLTVVEFESLYGLEIARRVLREWTDKYGIRRAAIWTRGKGAEQVVDVANSLGIRVVAVYDPRGLHLGETLWRGVPLRAVEDREMKGVDGLIVGSLSPGAAEDLRLELSASFVGLPIVSLAPWADAG